MLGALQSSGFPFQTAVAQAVIAAGRGGWVLEASEYAWQGIQGESEFLDLVATNRTLFLTLECKKARHQIYTFLRPLGLDNTGPVETFRCLRADRIRDSSQRVEIYCEEWSLFPISYCSQFCVVSNASAAEGRLLEKNAGLLVRATEAFAENFRRRSTPESPVSTMCLFVPVIVTNAPLYAARYDPRAVSFKTGEFDKLPIGEIELVPAVRFRKTFPSDGRSDLGGRSVFVVNASHFPEFLGLLNAAPIQPDDRVRVRFRHRLRTD